MKRPIVEQPHEPVEPILPSSPPRSNGNTTFVAMRHRNFQLYFGNLLIGFLGEKLDLGIAMTLFALCSLIFSRLVLMRTPEIQKLY